MLPHFLQFLAQIFNYAHVLIVELVDLGTKHRIAAGVFGIWFWEYKAIEICQFISDFLQGKR